MSDRDDLAAMLRISVEGFIAGNHDRAGMNGHSGVLPPSDRRFWRQMAQIG